MVLCPHRCSGGYGGGMEKDALWSNTATARQCQKWAATCEEEEDCGFCCANPRFKTKKLVQFYGHRDLLKSTLVAVEGRGVK